MPSLRIGEHGLAEPARHHRQRQRALVEVLRCRQHARGDIATGDDRVLHTLHHHVDAFGSRQRPVAGSSVGSAAASAQPKRWLPSPSSTMRSMRTHGCSRAGRRSPSFCASRSRRTSGVVPAARAARVRAPAAAAVPARRDHRPAGRSPAMRQRRASMTNHDGASAPGASSLFPRYVPFEIVLPAPAVPAAVLQEREPRLRHHGQPRHRATGAMPEYRSAGAGVSEG